MTSLAVLPLKKTLTDLMDEDLYSAPGGAAAPAVPPSPQMNSNTTPATLSSLLNIPDSFVEQYNRLNSSNHNLSAPAGVPSDSFASFDTNFYDQPQFINPFNAYATPDSVGGNMAQTQQLPAYVKPEHMQLNMRPARRGRIFTLDEPETNVGKQTKDDDYYLFNTDIQPSQMMENKNYFNTEDAVNNSLFILNSDLDPSSHLNDLPVPGFEGDYLNIDAFAEDAEVVSDDSDDDNYFQDDGDDFNYEDFGTEQYPSQVASPANFMKITPSQRENSTMHTDVGYMDDLHKMVSIDSVDMQLETSETPGEDTMTYDDETAPGFRKSSVDLENLNGNLHHSEEYHKTAAEITATNPNHQCELINPSTGKLCNKQFSRPYDLIRHQETIHASKKKIFRCVICEGRVNGGSGNGKSKTFSRGDALSRHIKVKHGLSGQEAVELINEAKENFEYVLA